jgi:hypothetical protein
VTYGLKSEESTPNFQQVPEPTPLQAKAYALLALLPLVTVMRATTRISFSLRRFTPRL